MDNIALGQALQGKSGSGQSAWVNPSQAINLGFGAASFLPMVGQAASLGSALYGGIRGSQGLTSQVPNGVGGMINPENPGLLQQAGNWLGSQFASNPQLPASAGTQGNPQVSSSGMQGATQSTQPYTVGGQTYNLNFDPSMLTSALNNLNRLPSLNFTTAGQSSSPGQWSQNGVAQSRVGYAPGADFMSGFGGQSGYESGGGQLGLRISAR